MVRATPGRGGCSMLFLKKKNNNFNYVFFLKKKFYLFIFLIKQSIFKLIYNKLLLFKGLNSLYPCALRPLFFAPSILFFLPNLVLVV
jgi:hypothetical protein